MSNPMTPDLIEVFHSPDRAPCADRAFMLAAVNIPAVIEFGPTGYVVRVPHAQAAFAAHHLWQYEQELRRRPRVMPQARLFPHAWVGSTLYVAVLVAVAFAAVQGLWRPDLFAVGTLDGAAVQAGQWWRAFTALTLHVDIVHLMMNLGAGAAIGHLLGRQIGAGSAWLLTVLGAGLANFLEALLGPPAHQSVGASTAIFAALGILAVHSWRTRTAAAPTRVRGVAPLVAGVVLLGFLGTTGEGTDLIAHAFGFVVGGAIGGVVAVPAIWMRLEKIPQWLAGAFTLLLVAIAWLLAAA